MVGECRIVASKAAQLLSARNVRGAFGLISSNVSSAGARSRDPRYLGSLVGGRLRVYPHCPGLPAPGFFALAPDWP